MNLPEIRPITVAQTLPLRHQILWPHKPLAYVQLPEDADGQHFGAFVDGHSPEEPVSVISLFIDEEKAEARFRKFATAEEWQGKGIGSALLGFVMEVVKAQNAAGVRITSIWCDSRKSASKFYEKFGMRAEGGTFYKGDVEYIRLRGVIEQGK